MSGMFDPAVKNKRKANPQKSYKKDFERTHEKRMKSPPSKGRQKWDPKLESD